MDTCLRRASAKHWVAGQRAVRWEGCRAATWSTVPQALDAAGRMGACSWGTRGFSGRVCRGVTSQNDPRKRRRGGGVCPAPSHPLSLQHYLIHPSIGTLHLTLSCVPMATRKSDSRPWDLVFGTSLKEKGLGVPTERTEGERKWEREKRREQISRGLCPVQSISPPGNYEAA